MFDVMSDKESVFAALAKPIRRLLADRGFREPTLPQERAIPLILEGKKCVARHSLARKNDDYSQPKNLKMSPASSFTSLKTLRA